MHWGYGKTLGAKGKMKLLRPELPDPKVWSWSPGSHSDPHAMVLDLRQVVPAQPVS